MCPFFDLLVLVGYLFFNFLHRLFDIVDILDLFGGWIGRDIVENFGDLDIFVMQLVNHVSEFLIFFVECLSVLGVWAVESLVELVNELVNHTDIARSDPYETLSNILFPFGHDCSVLEIRLDGIHGHGADLLKLLHLVLVALVDV